MNGLDGNQHSLVVLPAAAVSNHVKEIAEKKCPIILAIFQRILMTDVRVLSKRNLLVK